MSLEDLISRPHAWFGGGPACPIALSSRVRLARNLAGEPFPGRCGMEDRDRIWHRMEPILRGIPSLVRVETAGFADLTELERQMLVERHLISRELAAHTRGSGVAIRQDESAVIMVNEEDVFRIQSFRPGLDLREAWRTADAVDTELQSVAPFAFDSRWGYLTACPSNVGTGMRASVMLHLAGLALIDEMGPVINGIQKLGLTVRGVWGEGTEASGNLFQVSNQMTLGERDEDIVSSLEQIALELVRHEKNARHRLLESRRTLLEDHVGRAYGILTHAHILSSKEALDLLSALRLAVDAGILKSVDRSRIDELLLLSQPAHLQWREGKVLSPEDRDVARAQLIRSRLFEKISGSDRSDLK
ncbi:MAG: protein arginine kinase [Kiritimatiellia bacterium]|nr:protein arginine kinase [Kiritimatiellia bacterium]